MYMEGFAIVTVILFGIFWLVGFVAGIRTFWLFYEIRGHWAPGRSWGKLLFFSLFFSYFFTEKGNVYRVQLLNALAIFILSAMCGIGTGVWNENLRPADSSDVIDADKIGKASAK